MNVIRVGSPGLVGALFVLFGVQPIFTGLQPSDTGGLIGGIHTAVIPTGIGIALLLTALAVARRTRLGYVLGIAAGILLALAGLGLVILEIPYLGQGGLSAAFAGPFMVIGGVWSLLWMLYAWRISKARATFAPAWQPNDRRLAVVVLALVVVTAGVFVGAGIVQDQATARGAVDQGQLQEMVNATEFHVRTLDATVDQASGASGPSIAQITVEFTLQSPQAYALVAPPTVCLTDLVTFQDSAYKTGSYCWGTTGSALVLGSDFANLTVPAGMTKFRAALSRTGSPCAFGAGLWNAELTLAPGPKADATGAAVLVPEQYRLTAWFQVGGTDGEPPPPSGTLTAGDCIASTVSP